MIDIDRAYTLLEEIAEELPEEFWNQLNGGISLLPRTKRNREIPGKTLYILGEYHEEAAMGRYIVLYYGSFRHVFGEEISEAELKEHLRKTVYHEFTHHVEALAGERGLEIKDAQRMAGYQMEAQAAANTNSNHSSS